MPAGPVSQRSWWVNGSRSLRRRARSGALFWTLAAFFANLVHTMNSTRRCCCGTTDPTLRATPWYTKDHEGLHCWGPAEAAVRDASPIVAARGAVPAGYAWAPEIETGVDKWSTMRWGWHGARLFWRGCAGQWIIGEYHDAVGRRHIFVRRNQRMYSDASGAKPRFTAYEDAKAYCETIDAHWPRTRKPV